MLKDGLTLDSFIQKQSMGYYLWLKLQQIRANINNYSRKIIIENLNCRISLLAGKVTVCRYFQKVTGDGIWRVTTHAKRPYLWMSWIGCQETDRLERSRNLCADLVSRDECYFNRVLEQTLVKYVIVLSPRTMH